MMAKRRKSFLGWTTGFFGMATGAVGALATLGLLFNMFAIWWYADHFFGEKETLEIEAIIVLAGFAAVLLYNSLSIVWVILDGFYFKKYTAFDFMLIMFGVACIILMYGEKTVIDEIGRATLLGWKTTGEWVILYILLSIQMIYSVLILLRRFAPHLVGYDD